MARGWTAGLLALVFVLGGCLGDGEKKTADPDGPLTVYVSLPLGGISGDEGRAVSAGIRMAFGDARDRAGSIPVRLVTLDSTRGRGEPWDPGQVLANAERAKDDSSAIAYIGELDLGASAISVPETNEANLLQVSPYDGLTSLTRSPPGRAGRGAPVRYYPNGHRSFVRLVPNDLREADTMVGRLSDLGATRVALVTGQGVYATELAAQLAQRIRSPAGPSWPRRRWRRTQTGRLRGGRLEEARPDAVVYSGIGDRPANELLAELAKRPAAPVLATGRGCSCAGRRPSGPPPPRSRRSARSGRPTGTATGGARCSRGCARAGDAAAARPEALYGYEAARVVLSAVREGGPAPPGGGEGRPAPAGPPRALRSLRGEALAAT